MTDAKREILAAYDKAVADPDLRMVAMSPRAVEQVGPLGDGIVLPEVAGTVLVFYYARERENRRLLALDAEGAAWVMAMRASGDFAAIEPWRTRDG